MNFAMLRRGLGLSLAIGTAAMVSLLFVADREAIAKGDDSAETCVTAKCHINMGKDVFVHGPVATGACTMCHIPDGKHKFKPIVDVAKACYECHERVDSRMVVHSPVKAGQCTKCHNPHQSPNKFMLRGAGAELCYICHNRAMVNFKFLHGPVAPGSCSSCHAAHQSDFPKLLMAKGNDVCFSCHKDKADAFKKKFVHKPVQDSCISCHNPHGGNHKFNLKAESSENLCFLCHKDKEKWISEVKVKHKGLDTSKKCLSCHDPHASDNIKQLVNVPADLCMTCHNREYAAGGVKTMNMKALLEKNTMLHGPIAQKDCSSCHNTHGSNNYRMLRANFPPIFYSGYNTENYKLCFMCHEASLAEEELTSTMTGFRNGFKNLHFIHVNKATKGRTCRACHDAHATRNARHIRDAVPFGAWKVPIGFTKASNGGTCLPGCHKLYGYDRNTPVQN